MKHNGIGLAFLGLLAAGCGGGDDDDTGSSGSSTTSSTESFYCGHGGTCYSCADDAAFKTCLKSGDGDCSETDSSNCPGL